MSQAWRLSRPSLTAVTAGHHTASCGLRVTGTTPLVKGAITMPTLIAPRGMQTSSSKSSPSAVSLLNRDTTKNESNKAPMPTCALSILPLSTVVRSLAITTVSSSPLLLPPALAIMDVLAHTQAPLLQPDRNPLLRYLLKKTVYSQFCAGETGQEVRVTIDGLKRMGFAGVILGYAREVVLTESQTKDLAASFGGKAVEECLETEITPWMKGTLETVRLAQPGDFVAIKLTGAGRHALYTLQKGLPPSAELRTAIDEVCDLAKDRNVPVLFDAEQHSLQATIDDWTLQYQRKHNSVPGHAIIYGTYQAYLKATPATLANHLAIAAKEGFTLGVKLVRGAYLGSDPRHVIHDTKQDTDHCYNAIAESLIKQQWGSVLKQPQADVPFPTVSLVLGSHNHESVRKARDVRAALPPSEGVQELAIAQLQGMADEVSCEMVSREPADEKDKLVGRTRAYKYLVWGTTGECMKYLLRRAYENRDAVQRTREGRNAMFRELTRRIGALFGLGK